MYSYIGESWGMVNTFLNLKAYEYKENNIYVIIFM